jgi:hypothetical protein
MVARSGTWRAADDRGGDAEGDPLHEIREAAADLRWLDAFEALSALERRSGLTAGIWSCWRRPRSCSVGPRSAGRRGCAHISSTFTMASVVGRRGALPGSVWSS